MKRWNLALLAVFLLPIAASTATTSDQDILGFYFDAAAESNCVESSAFVTIPLHLVLTNSSTSSLYGYEFGFTATGNYMISGIALNGSSPLDVGGSEDNHIVGLDSPLSASGATILATLSVLVMDANLIRFDLHGADPASIPENPELPVLLLANDTLVNATLSTPPGFPNARINGICDAETVEGSWDGVKSLYQ